MTIMRDWPTGYPGLTDTIEWRARRTLLSLIGAVAETLRDVARAVAGTPGVGRSFCTRFA